MSLLYHEEVALRRSWPALHVSSSHSPSLPPILSPSILPALSLSVSLSLFLDHTPSIVSHETSHWPQNTSVPRFNEAPRPFTDVGGSCSEGSQWPVRCLTRLDTRSSVGTDRVSLRSPDRCSCMPARRFWGSDFAGIFG